MTTPDSNPSEDQILQHAITELAGVLGTEARAHIPGAHADALWLACQRITEAMEITIVKPNAHANTFKDAYSYLLAIAQASRFRVRNVSLKALWWLEDNGPLLAFDGEQNAPVALLWDRKNQYVLYEPLAETYTPITAERAQALAIDAYCFYPTFSDTSDKPLRLIDVIKFAFKNRKRDILQLFIFQLCMGLLGLFIPIATGRLLGEVIPNAETHLLTQWILGLTVFMVSIAFFNCAQTLALIRLRYKADAYTQAAVWDRLLRLPVSFFRRFSPGDLGVRTEGIEHIQQELTGASLQTIFGGVFSLLLLGLMFYYSLWLALGALVLLGVVVAILFLSARMQLRFQRPIANLNGYLFALTLQCLNAIGTLRVSHSESRVFSIWAETFAHKSRLFFKAGIWAAFFNGISMLLPLLGIMGLYAAVGSYGVQLELSAFIGFNAAYGMFFAAVVAMFAVFTRWVDMIPHYERIQPILTAQPEREAEGLALSLTGTLAVKKLSFRYESDGPWILREVTIEAQAGEMIALVGPVGAGKSTIVRLLLGYEEPTAGVVEYDYHNLTNLNIRNVREQLGVVMQNATLLPGTIFENIQGSSMITLDQAWEAAAAAGLSEMIQALPMGMHTLISEGAKTFSMGQRQRLLIAQVLARKPKIMILDEATSALDNPTQEKIMDTLKQYHITRIVIAHRMSTLKSADRIYVLQEGQIVQVGDYETLLSKKGLFESLAHRQLQ